MCGYVFARVCEMVFSYIYKQYTLMKENKIKFSHNFNIKAISFSDKKKTILPLNSYVPKPISLRV